MMDNSFNKYKINDMIDNMDLDSVKSLCKNLAFSIIQSNPEGGEIKFLLECLKINSQTTKVPKQISLDKENTEIVEKLYDIMDRINGWKK